MDAVAAGVPVVAWPMISDQKLCALWLGRNSAAIMVEGTGWTPGRIVPAVEITEVIQKVGGLGQDKNTPFRRAMKRLQEILQRATGTDGSSTAEFYSLLGAMKKL